MIPDKNDINMEMSLHRPSEGTAQKKNAASVRDRGSAEQNKV